VTILVRPISLADAGAVLAIYQACIDTGNATFETTAPTWTRFDAGHLPGHRHVAVDGAGADTGWIAATAGESARRWWPR